MNKNKPFLGFLASRKARKANYPTLREFIRQFPHVLDEYTLLVTGGTFDDVFCRGARNPLNDLGEKAWKKYSREFSGRVLRYGKEGGLIQLSESTLNPEMKTGVIIFFIDPRDAEENLPENRELFRMCAMEDKDLNLPTYYKTPILLINYRSAALWASNEAEGAKNEIPAAEKGDTLALIAHDNRKLDMCHFIVKHREKLKFFDRIITTGTTGEWVEKFLNLFGDINLRVERKKSGPVGGDVMISNEILEGRCQHVCFFLDPETAHPHEADIYALFRTCTFSGVTVNLRMTYHAAESWIKTVKV